jgi:hypothetical protein
LAAVCTDEKKFFTPLTQDYVLLGRVDVKPVLNRFKQDPNWFSEIKLVPTVLDGRTDSEFISWNILVEKKNILSLSRKLTRITYKPFGGLSDHRVKNTVLFDAKVTKTTSVERHGCHQF